MKTVKLRVKIVKHTFSIPQFLRAPSKFLKLYFILHKSDFLIICFRKFMKQVSLNSQNEIFRTKFLKKKIEKNFSRTYKMYFEKKRFGMY